MLGSSGERMLALGLPHADAWNTWYDRYGNVAEGFAAENERITAAARRAGREPTQIERSACAFVLLEREPGGRPVSDEHPPITGTPEAIADRLRELAEAGADEAILVVQPITEASIRSLGAVLAALDRG
jgi:alkanesulfonate monooxygenase SsuD/methylene tetrahydromethanopterin reductase-like flavin-dependent oxidoreductase (luciferase family)